jgi:hypothetical protein
VTDAHETFGQHVQKEAAQELCRCQCHLALLATMGVILPSKSAVEQIKVQWTVIHAFTQHVDDAALADLRREAREKF